MGTYKEYGYTNERSTHAHTYIQEPLLSMLDPRKNKCILDLGCGNGALVRILLLKGYNAYGTDASQQGISIAKKSDPHHFALQDLSKDELPIEFKDLPFDTIIATEVIEHLYDPRNFISFCKRILQRNAVKGELILSTPYHGYLKNLTIGVTGAWDNHANPLWDGGHIKLWSRSTLTKLLQEHNFNVTDFKGCGRLPYLWKSMLMKGSLTNG